MTSASDYVTLKTQSKDPSECPNKQSIEEIQDVKEKLIEMEGHGKEGLDEDTLCDDEDQSLSHSFNSSQALILWRSFLFSCPFENCFTPPFMASSVKSILSHLESAHHLRIKINKIKEVLPYFEEYLNARLDLFLQNSYLSDVKMVEEWGQERDQEDRELRDRLQDLALKNALEILEQDRREPFSEKGKKCLFCKEVFYSRSSLFHHMFETHAFHIGHPDNVVNVEEFLKTLELKMSDLACIYCEKVFPAGMLLRKHMRKKKHFKIHPENIVYDQFYVVNYLDTDTANLRRAHMNSPAVSERGDTETWSDWEDETVQEETMCLFDDNVFPSSEQAIKHMKEEHGFDLESIKVSRNLDYYGMVRLINFIRRQTSFCVCFGCGFEAHDLDSLVKHYKVTDHICKIPHKDSPLWEDPNYLFPTYENDPLLMHECLIINED